MKLAFILIMFFGNSVFGQSALPPISDSKEIQRILTDALFQKESENALQLKVESLFLTAMEKDPITVPVMAALCLNKIAQFSKSQKDRINVTSIDDVAYIDADLVIDAIIRATGESQEELAIGYHSVVTRIYKVCIGILQISARKKVKNGASEGLELFLDVQLNVIQRAKKIVQAWQVLMPNILESFKNIRDKYYIEKSKKLENDLNKFNKDLDEAIKQRKKLPGVPTNPWITKSKYYPAT